MHHSRNSEQKQWDETVVIALGGMGRLLKAHLPAVARLEGFPAGVCGPRAARRRPLLHVQESGCARMRGPCSKQHHKPAPP